jgi:hypothetical protein
MSDSFCILFLPLALPSWLAAQQMLPGLPLGNRQYGTPIFRHRRPLVPGFAGRAGRRDRYTM